MKSRQHNVELCQKPHAAWLYVQHSTCARAWAEGLVKLLSPWFSCRLVVLMPSADDSRTRTPQSKVLASLFYRRFKKGVLFKL